MVERFFADLTQDCVRAGSFASVAELVEAIVAYLASRNENPKPYQWKADGAKTLASNAARQSERKFKERRKNNTRFHWQTIVNHELT